MDEKVYRPKHIEFQASTDGSNMPECLGKFETAEEMAKFVGTNLTAINIPLTVNRHLDPVEKDNLRKQCVNLMEEVIPVYEKKLIEAEGELARAKKAKKDAEEAYSHEIGKAKELAYRAKRGLIEIDLDSKYTFRIPTDGYYYVYTWIDKELRLCLVRPIPDNEKQDLYNAMAHNESFVLNNFTDKEDK